MSNYDEGNRESGIQRWNIVLEKYVEKIFQDIPDSERKTELMQEILQNLSEKVYDLKAQGKTEEDAINKAIVDFGDIDDIKQELKGKGDTLKSRSRPGLTLGYSVCGSLLVIALVLFINFYYTPHVIWFVYPTIAVLWWPLTMFFRWLRLK